jgi:hypothetical protein
MHVVTTPLFHMRGIEFFFVGSALFGRSEVYSKTPSIMAAGNGGKPPCSTSRGGVSKSVLYERDQEMGGPAGLGRETVTGLDILDYCS